ncbi:MAG: hypothetical protein ICV60_11320 [Pyrinomonadaceae bacterium]|nr:hypothetical protein [Pyrinomonadaceae bacterium]
MKDELARCYSGRLPIVSSYTAHFGEEPALVGSNGGGNIFFYIFDYCQNLEFFNQNAKGVEGSKQEQLGLFIRKLVGLDREAAKLAFGEFLARNNLTANQIRFIDQIIDYLTQNGVMDPGQPYESPFTDYSPGGLDGVFNDAYADGIISILEAVRQNAAA